MLSRLMAASSSTPSSSWSLVSLPMVASCWRMRSSGQMAASGHKLAFLPPACLSDNLHAAIFRHNFSQEIFTFFENGKIHTHTCQLDARTCFYTISPAGRLLSSWWTPTPICWSPPPVPAFVRASANVNRSFYRGELFIQVGAFYSPNERFSLRIGLPSLNAIFPDTNERRIIDIQMFLLR